MRLPSLVVLCFYLVKTSSAIDVENIDPDTCPPLLDIAFVMDTSASTEEVYREHVRWTVSLVDALPVHQDAVRVAAIQYAEIPITEFSLNTYSDVGDVVKHLDEIAFQSGVTKTGLALKSADNELFNVQRGARKNASKVLVIFTDGLSIDDPIKQSNALRQKGTQIYVISVGTDGFVPEMQRIAGEVDNVYGPADLDRFKDQLMSEVEETRQCSNVTKENAAIEVAKTMNGTTTTSPTSQGTIEQSMKEETPGLSTIIPTQKAGKRKSIKDIKNVDVQTVTSMMRMPVEETTTREATTTMVATTSVQTTTSTPEQTTTTTVNATPVTNTSPKNTTIKATTPTPQVMPTLISIEELVPAIPRRIKKIRKIVRRIYKKTQESDGNEDVKEKIEKAKKKVVRRLKKIIRKAKPTINDTKLESPTQRPPTTTTLARSTAPTPVATITLPPTTRTTTPRRTTSTIASTIPVTTLDSTTTPLPTLITMTRKSFKAHKKTLPTTIATTISSTALPTTTPREITTNRWSRTPRPTITRRPTTTTPLFVPPTEKTKTNNRAFASVNQVVTVGQQCPMDILFVVDSSGSVQGIYNKQKDFLSNLLSYIEPEAQSHRVALIQFAGAHLQKMEWTFDSYSQNDELMRAFNGVRHFTGTTYIGAALRLAVSQLDSRRAGVPTVVVLVSDGFSQDDATAPALQIKSMPNVETFAVSLADLSNLPFLGEFASDDSHVFVGQDVDFLKGKLIDRFNCIR